MWSNVTAVWYTGIRPTHGQHIKEKKKTAQQSSPSSPLWTRLKRCRALCSPTCPWIPSLSHTHTQQECISLLRLYWFDVTTFVKHFWNKANANTLATTDRRSGQQEQGGWGQKQMWGQRNGWMAGRIWIWMRKHSERLCGVCGAARQRGRERWTMGGRCGAIRSRRLLKYSLCGEVIEKVGLLSPTCHHVVSSPCSLPPLPNNLRQSAEQKQTSFSLSCPTTSSRGFWTLAPSPPALQVCTSAGWLFYTHLQTHLRSQTTPSSTSFPIVLPLWLPGPLPPPSFNPLPFALHPSLLAPG